MITCVDIQTIWNNYHSTTFMAVICIKGLMLSKKKWARTQRKIILQEKYVPRMITQMPSKC